MKKLKFLCKICAFFIIFCGLLFVVQEHLRDKWAEGEYNPSAKIDGFYAEEKNTLDVVFIGSSQMYADMAPAVLFERYGITSYDFCANEQPLWVSYYYIKEAIKQQHPKVIVLDVFTVYGDDYEEEGVMHINLDDLKMGQNKIQAIRDGVPKDLRYSFYFPIAKYHNTWTDFSEGKMKYSFYKEKDPYKGYSPFIFAAEYDDFAKAEVVDQTVIQELPPKAEEWLYRIIELCKQENTNLLLIKTPNGHANRQKLYNAVERIAEETNTPFYNMNTILDGQAHINVIQAEKVSDLMGKYLTMHYAFEDKRQDERYREWEYSVLLFKRQKAKCQVISAEDFRSYLPLLNDEGYMIFVVAKNEQGQAFSKEDIDFLNQTLKLNCMLDTDKAQPYFAVIDSQVVIAESCQPSSVEIAAEGLSIELYSSGSVRDGASNIMINGTDFCLNYDGLNFAVYDKVLGEMIDMTAFDMLNDMEMIRK